MITPPVTWCRDDIAFALARIAYDAGRILARMQGDIPPPDFKSDMSPVTAADFASERLIVAALKQAFPDVPIISEENSASHEGFGYDRFLLVDPLDGTRSFLAGKDDYVVLIAMIEQGQPISGAVHAPVSGQTWWAGSRLFHAMQAVEAGQPVTDLPRSPERGETERVALGSYFHADAETDAILAQWQVSRVIRMSSGLKFVRLALGEADLYPRRSPTMQWDIAAGDALLRAVGGGILNDAGDLMVYGRSDCGWFSPPFLAHARLP
ncbi:CysQ 3'-Phosphoadenosine 5'-phosphosulfate (PAPS) 3'-phosphatase [Rhabdaerophilaceae bacterium]